MKALLFALFWGVVFVFVSILGEFCGVVHPAIGLLKIISVFCIVAGVVQAFYGGDDVDDQELQLDAYADRFIRNSRRQAAAGRVLPDKE